MPYDQILEDRILKIVTHWKGVEAKKMFGGICHLIHGNMFAGVYKTFLILRLGEAGAAAALSDLHVKPFDITGKPMKGWVMVGPEAVRTDAALESRLLAAKRFAETLPKK